MTELSQDPTAHLPEGRQRGVLRVITDRLRERRFWIVQAGVVAVTATHLLFEALSEGAVERGDLAEGLHHIPVVLYALPVLYAGLMYGLEGGLLTGLLAAALVAPSIPRWHAEDFAWVGEVLFAGVVIATGIVLSIPVERERRQRIRSEAAARRLALVNDVTAELARPGDLDRRTRAALDHVLDVLDVDGAWLSLWRRGVEEPVVGTGATDPVADDVLVTPVLAGEITGSLAVRPRQPPLPAEDRMLVAAVGHQLGIAVENALLHEDERARLHSYVHAVTQAQEDERKRVARDLHDESAQELALLSRSLGDLRERLQDRPDDAARAEALRNRARATLEGVRRFSHDLRPTLLDDFGLVAALESLVSQLGTHSRLHTDFVVEGSARRLPMETEIALFRITQEALRNVERHAGADRVDVRCEFGPGHLQLRVADDGRGFDVPAERDLLARGHLGLVGMRERAQLVGASVETTSHAGRGTQVVIDLDVEEPRGGES